MSETIMPTKTLEVIDDNEKFILYDIEGGELEIPKVLPWGKEKKILTIVGVAFKKVMPMKSDSDKPPFNSDEFIEFAKIKFNLDENSLESIRKVAIDYSNENSENTQVNMSDLLEFFTTEAPDLITDLISIMTGKSVEDVDNSYTGESVLAFAIPYLIHAMKKYASSFVSNF